jgi:hypothetical protein
MVRQLHRWLIFIFIIDLLSSSAITQANPLGQFGERLTFGQPVIGSIDDNNFRQSYTFSGRDGQVITLTMTSQSGDLDPYLILMSETGAFLQSNDDSGTLHNAAIQSYRLPETGEFTVIATRFGHSHGSTSGDYELRLDSLGTTTVRQEGSLISYGDRIPGELSNEAFETFFVFEGRRGDVITIRLVRTSGDLDPVIDLYSEPSNQPLIVGDDTATSLNAEIRDFMLPEDDDGIYIIRATRHGRAGGSTQGTYLLLLTQTPVETLGTRPNNARFIRYGDEVIATIDDEVPIRFFQFEAHRGDLISAAAIRESDDLSPTLSLLDSELRPVSVSPEVEDQSESRIPGASIPEDGLYYLAVSRYEGIDGETIGAFRLQLNGRQGVNVNMGLELVYGAQMNGYLDNENFAANYVFVGAGGDIVTITMQRTEGNLDPLLTLHDITGKLLISNDDGFAEGSQDALIRNYTLPADGIYIIEASRYQRVAGETSGDYVLTLEIED